MDCVEEYARHDMCLSKVVGNESGASVGSGLSQQWGIGAARLPIFTYEEFRCEKSFDLRSLCKVSV